MIQAIGKGVEKLGNKGTGKVWYENIGNNSHKDKKSAKNKELHTAVAT